MTRDIGLHCVVPRPGPTSLGDAGGTQSPKLGVLGPVSYRARDGFRAPAGSRQQKILATLVLHIDQVVPEDRLVRAIWDEAPPLTARRQIINGVSKLRRELAPAGAGVINRSPGGYLLSLRTGRTDVDQFRTLVDGARGAVDRQDLAEGARLFRAAIRLWRGPALAGLETSSLRAAADSLEEGRMIALEELSRLELRQGVPAVAFELLADPIQRYPFREQLVAFRMLALLGMSRRVEALETYTRFRRSLADELGIEPPRQLAELQLRILNGINYADALAAQLPEPTSSRRAVAGPGSRCRSMPVAAGS